MGDYALTSPAVELFIDTLNYQNAMGYLANFYLLKVESHLALDILMVLGAVLSIVCFACMVCRWKHYKTASYKGKCLLMFCAMSLFVYGAVKNILSKSGSDDEITLVKAETENTNGFSRVYVESLDKPPEPMWYRNFKDQSWIKGVDNGWTLTTAIDDGNYYVREWRYPSDDKEVVNWNMWYFGENPPAVEIVEQGGIEIISFAASGRNVTLIYRIGPEVELSDKAVLTIECSETRMDGVDLWVPLAVNSSPVHGDCEYKFNGFYLDRATKWRVRLEVPE